MCHGAELDVDIEGEEFTSVRDVVLDEVRLWNFPESQWAVDVGMLERWCGWWYDSAAVAVVSSGCFRVAVWSGKDGLLCARGRRRIRKRMKRVRMMAATAVPIMMPARAAWLRRCAVLGGEGRKVDGDGVEEAAVA